MYIVFIVLIFIAAALMVLTVLAQSPKGGMAANFGASNQVAGARQTADFLEKFTWGLAISIVAFSIGATMSLPESDIEQNKARLEVEAVPQVDITEGLPSALPTTTGDSVK